MPAPVPPPPPETEEDPAPATADTGVRGASEGTGGVERRQEESLEDSRCGRGDGIRVGGEGASGASELTAAQHKHCSSAGSESGSSMFRSKPSTTNRRSLPLSVSVSGTVSVSVEGGHRSRDTVPVKNNMSSPEMGSGGAVSGSSGSESESVSGGDSSDDDDLFIEGIREDGKAAPKGNFSGDKTVKTTEQAAEGSIVRQAVSWARGVGGVAASTRTTMGNDLPNEASGSGVEAAERAEDPRDRPDGSPERQKQEREHQLATAAPPDPDPDASISPAISPSGLGVEVDNDGDCYRGSCAAAAAAVGEGSMLEAAAAVEGAVEMEAGVIDEDAATETDDSEMEWPDEINSGTNTHGGGDGGGVDAIELPGPLDVQLVGEVEAGLGHAPVVETRKTRIAAGLLPADFDGRRRQPRVSAPDDVSSSPRSSAPPASRYLHSAADDTAVRVVTGLGRVNRQAEVAPQSSSEVTATFPEDGTDKGLSVASGDKRCTELPPPPTLTPTAFPGVENETGDAGGQTETADDPEAIQPRDSAKKARSRPAKYPVRAERVPGVDTCIAGSSKGSNDNIHSSSNCWNTVANAAAPAEPQQQQQQQQRVPIASPAQPRKSSTVLTSPNLQTRNGDGEHGGGRNGFTVRGKPAADGAPPNKSSGRTVVRYSDCFPTFAAVLSAHHNGQALTRYVDIGGNGAKTPKFCPLSQSACRVLEYWRAGLPKNHDAVMDSGGILTSFAPRNPSS